MRALPEISSAMLVVTHECNLRCRYCFVQKEPESMTLETAKAAARFLIENARRAGTVPEINFFGGEPLLKFDGIMRPLTEWVHDELGERMRFSVTTNGTLLTPERTGFMKRHGFSLLLSMDGSARAQDFNRPDAAGRGTFERLRGVVPMILAAWPGTVFRMTAIPASCRFTFEGIMWAAAQGFRSFFVTPNVFEPWDDESWAALAGEMRKYADYAAESRERGVKYIRFSAFEQARSDLRAIERARERGEWRALPRCRAAGKCGLGASRFASVHPDGRLFACQELTSNEGGIFEIGSVFTGADEGKRRALMAAFDAAPARGENCEGCEYDRVCDGGCAANNYLLTGAVNRVPETYCRWKRLLLDEARRIEEREGERCPLQA